MPIIAARCTGLYHCGSGAHPGGGVTGAPGHNAAQAILRDHRALFALGCGKGGENVRRAVGNTVIGTGDV